MTCGFDHCSTSLHTRPLLYKVAACLPVDANKSKDDELKTDFLFGMEVEVVVGSSSSCCC